MEKKHISMVLAAAVAVIGIYMFSSYEWMTPPSVSGIGFFLTALALWIPHCPICAKICKK